MRLIWFNRIRAQCSSAIFQALESQIDRSRPTTKQLDFFITLECTRTLKVEVILNEEYTHLLLSLGYKWKASTFYSRIASPSNYVRGEISSSQKLQFLNSLEEIEKLTIEFIANK